MIRTAGEPTEDMTAAVYRFKGRLYVNLTNRCPTACGFCAKFSEGYRFEGRSLRLAKEPEPEDVLKAIEREPACREAVFCGYGEPTYRMDALARIGKVLRERGIRVRLNTIGLGCLINGRDIVPDFKDCLDAVSVSLNTTDPEQWGRIHRPRPRYRDGGFKAVLDFTRDCVRLPLETTLTAVDRPEADLSAVRLLAEKLGAGFRKRPFLPEHDEV